MEISEQTILELVKSQGALTQAVNDVKERFDKAIPYLVAEDKKNADEIQGVKNKILYFSGAGSVLGFLGSHIVDKYFHFGGK